MRKLSHKEYPKCLGCGFCCMSSMCSVGISMLGRRVEQCPYLFWSWRSGRYWCELVLTGRIEPEVLATGFGCPSNLNSWRKNVRRREYAELGKS